MPLNAAQLSGAEALIKSSLQSFVSISGPPAPCWFMLLRFHAVSVQPQKGKALLLHTGPVNYGGEQLAYPQSTPQSCI